MLVRSIMSLHRALLLVVLAVGLIATGFAHRMPTPQDGALAFALANGAGVSDFCGSIPGSDGAKSIHCPACQITASAHVPPESGSLITLDLAFHSAVIAPHQTLALRRVLDPAHAPQGPPVA